MRWGGMGLWQTPTRQVERLRELQLEDRDPQRGEWVLLVDEWPRGLRQASTFRGGRARRGSTQSYRASTHHDEDDLWLKGFEPGHLFVPSVDHCLPLADPWPGRWGVPLCTCEQATQSPLKDLHQESRRGTAHRDGLRLQWDVDYALG